MKDDWEWQYRKLRELDPSIYRRAIEYGEGVTLTHHLSAKAAADVEVALVSLALEIITGQKHP